MLIIHMPICYYVFFYLRSLFCITCVAKGRWIPRPNNHQEKMQEKHLFSKHFFFCSNVHRPIRTLFGLFLFKRIFEKLHLDLVLHFHILILTNIFWLKLSKGVFAYSFWNLFWTFWNCWYFFPTRYSQTLILWIFQILLFFLTHFFSKLSAFIFWKYLKIIGKTIVGHGWMMSKCFFLLHKL